MLSSFFIYKFLIDCDFNIKMCVIAIILDINEINKLKILQIQGDITNIDSKVFLDLLIQCPFFYK